MKYANGQNAAIYEDDGRYVKYSAKCPSCGHIETTKRTAPLTTMVGCGTFICSKCKTKYEVKLRRG